MTELIDIYHYGVTVQLGSSERAIVAIDIPIRGEIVAVELRGTGIDMCAVRGLSTLPPKLEHPTRELTDEELEVEWHSLMDRPIGHVLGGVVAAGSTPFLVNGKALSIEIVVTAPIKVEPLLVSRALVYVSLVNYNSVTSALISAVLHVRRVP